ncbi:hypothetical protein OXYTRIMIC_788 [Oxytricha trifallax]|uniref:Uncharacterized protein n=1 Tax=Oxytricha trifallax TaxID=1172189 RepID=A0A073I0V2_9SPIT|nr:hypothetical protein OXYTRIMIC_788 [Oxytricha trifallax]
MSETQYRGCFKNYQNLSKRKVSCINAQNQGPLVIQQQTKNQEKGKSKQVTSGGFINQIKKENLIITPKREESSPQIKQENSEISMRNSDIRQSSISTKQNFPLESKLIQIDNQAVQTLVAKAHDILNRSDLVMQNIDKILPQIKIFYQRAQNTTKRVVTYLEQKLFKVDFKLKENELSTFISHQSSSLNQVESQLQFYETHINQIITQKMNEIKLSNHIELYEGNQIAIHGLFDKYDKLQKQLHDQIVALHKVDDSGIDIIKLDKLSDTDIKAQCILTLENTPNFMILDQDRLIADRIVYSFKQRCQVQIFDELATSGCVASDGLIILALHHSGRILILRFVDGQYLYLNQGNTCKRGGTQKKVFYNLIKTNPFIPFNLKCPTIFTQSDGLQLSKYVINLLKFEDSDKLRLCWRSKEFKFVDNRHLISQFELEYTLINHDNGQTLQICKLFGEIACIPDYLRAIDTTPILISYDQRSNIAQIQDIMKMGFKGDLKLQTQITSVLGQLESDQNENLLQQAPEVRLLAYDQNNNMIISTIQIE